MSGDIIETQWIKRWEWDTSFKLKRLLVEPKSSIKKKVEFLL